LLAKLFAPFRHVLTELFHLSSEGFLVEVAKILRRALVVSVTSEAATAHASASTHAAGEASATSLPRLLLLLFLIRNIFIDDSEKSSRSLLRIIDLDEGVRMGLGSLALGAVIEVL
jgi:hypothetical protein